MKNKSIYNIIGSIVIASGFVIFGVYTTKCHGEECEIKNISLNKEQNLFKMDPEAIIKQAENKEIIILDVRESYEWNEGHIEGALHIPQGYLSIETTKNLPKNIPIYLYCRSGRRAGEAEIKLKEMGFNNVRNIGGIIDWQEKGGSLVK